MTVLAPSSLYINYIQKESTYKHTCHPHQNEHFSAGTIAWHLAQQTLYKKKKLVESAYNIARGHLIHGSDVRHHLAPCMLKGEDRKSETTCFASRVRTFSFASWNPCLAVSTTPRWRSSVTPSWSPCHESTSIWRISSLPSHSDEDVYDDDAESIAWVDGSAAEGPGFCSPLLSWSAVTIWNERACSLCNRNGLRLPELRKLPRLHRDIISWWYHIHKTIKRGYDQCCQWMVSIHNKYQ